MKYSLFFLILCFGCTSTQTKKSTRLKIVCTTGIVADAIKSCTTDSCEVVALMGPGTDPHLFKPTKESLDLMAAADVIVANGLHLEGRMQDILEKMERSHRVIFLGDGLSPAELLYGDVNQKIPDPHIWFDVKLWKKAVQYALEEFAEAEPKFIDQTKSKAYGDMLDGLQNTVAAQMAEIPEGQRTLITAHDAFSYFGRAYNTEVIGLQGISTMAEYGIRDVTNLVDLIIAKQIKAVFVESSISSRSIEAVIAGCAERGFDVKEGGTLYSDALGNAASGADTYQGMVNANVKSIKNALK